MYDTWLRIISAIAPNMPIIVSALLVLCFGILLTWWTSHLVYTFLKQIYFPNTLERIGWDQIIKRSGFSSNCSLFFSVVIGSIFTLLCAMVCFEVLRLTVFAGFLEKVILYYPNVVISIVIGITSAYATDMAQKMFMGTKTLGSITYSRFLSRCVEWAIRVLAFLAIFYQLGIIPQLILLLFAGIILSVSLSLGIALGNAGKEPMSKLLKDIGKTFRGQ